MELGTNEQSKKEYAAYGYNWYTWPLAIAWFGLTKEHQTLCPVLHLPAGKLLPHIQGNEGAS